VDVVDRMTQQSMLHPEMFPGNSEQAINFSQAALLIQNSAFVRLITIEVELDIIILYGRFTQKRSSIFTI
jgi:hypothetical protein